MATAKGSIEESDNYLIAAEKIMNEGNGVKRYNVAITNSIMAMVKSVDAAMLEYTGMIKDSGRGHEKTANRLKELYNKGYISTEFKSNVRSVRKWVVDKKTEVQYRGEKVSKRDAKECLKAARRLNQKMREELNL